MPTYSKITVEFLVDYDIDYSLSIKSLLSGVQTTQTWEWVATRSAGFEVTKGTATGNAGETTATNFDAAFLLDNATGYSTTRTVNSLEIFSETLGQDFIGFKTSNGTNALQEGVDYNVTFENYTAPFDLISVKSILARSPHYVNTPFFFETTTKATINLYLWNGDVDTLPSEPSYTLTKIRPTIDYTEFNTDLSNIIKSALDSQLELTLTTAAGNVVNAGDLEFKWASYIASYTDPVENVTNVEGTFGSCAGYGYFRDGINPSLLTLAGKNGRYLTSLENRNVSNNGILILPFLNDGFYSQFRAVTAGTGGVGVLENLVTSDDSSDYIKYFMVDLSIADAGDRIVCDFIHIGGTDRLIYTVIENCEQEAKTIVFKNRFGFYDTVTMFAKTVETLKIDKSKFVNNYVENGTYDIEKHQIKDINIVANESFTVASGFIKESENVLIKEMLLSDTVYLWDKVNKNLNPIRTKTSSLTYKNRLNDNKVQYTVEFDYAYNTINNI